MPHPNAHTDPRRSLPMQVAAAIAEGMKAFSASSRVRLLYALLERSRTVEELAEAVSMEPPAVSQQLRILRQLDFVVADREGRRIRYRLHDHHVADLLAAIRHHHEHAASGWSDLDETPEPMSAGRRA